VTSTRFAAPLSEGIAGSEVVVFGINSLTLPIRASPGRRPGRLDDGPGRMITQVTCGVHVPDSFRMGGAGWIFGEIRAGLKERE
jgi:hypothetical protein